jgi:hypothetical protein
MATVAECFHEAICRNEPKKSDVDKAKDRHTKIRDALLKHKICDDTFLTGSYARSTAINPLHDVDIFAEFRADGDDISTAGAQLARVESILKRAMPEATLRRQKRSIGLSFDGVDTTFDVVPARKTAKGYSIPDRKLVFWLHTDPKTTMEACTKANSASKGRLLPLIKLAKRWNQHQAIVFKIADADGIVKPFKSFHLEVLCYGFSVPESSNDREALAGLFAFLASNVSRDVLPPGGGTSLSMYLNDGTHKFDSARLKEMLMVAAREATDAVQAETKRPKEAHGLWKTLLGDVYPM